MFIYSDFKTASEGVSGAVPQGAYQTNGTANTLTLHSYFTTGATRGCGVQSVYLSGKGAGLTAISGISARLARPTAGTVATGGTAGSIRPRDPGAQAAITTFLTDSSAITQNVTTDVLLLAVGCGAAGPGGWVAPNPDSVMFMNAGGGLTGHLQFFSTSGTISLFFDAIFEHVE